MAYEILSGLDKTTSKERFVPFSYFESFLRLSHWRLEGTKLQ